MWVCLCKGVNHRQIRAIIAAGARSPWEIAIQCRAGTGCGGCLPELRRLLHDYLGEQASSSAGGQCEPGRSSSKRAVPV